jgi:hypothetical protein
MRKSFESGSREKETRDGPSRNTAWRRF